jgi:hypothetical protein
VALGDYKSAEDQVMEYVAKMVPPRYLRRRYGDAPFDVILDVIDQVD